MVWSASIDAGLLLPRCINSARLQVMSVDFAKLGLHGRAMPRDRTERG